MGAIVTKWLWAARGLDFFALPVLLGAESGALGPGMEKKTPHSDFSYFLGAFCVSLALPYYSLLLFSQQKTFPRRWKI